MLMCDSSVVGRVRCGQKLACKNQFVRGTQLRPEVRSARQHVSVTALHVLCPLGRRIAMIGAPMHKHHQAHTSPSCGSATGGMIGCVPIHFVGIVRLAQTSLHVASQTLITRQTSNSELWVNPRTNPESRCTKIRG